MLQRCLQFTVGVVYTHVGIETVIVGIIIIFCHCRANFRLDDVLCLGIQAVCLQDIVALLRVGRAVKIRKLLIRDACIVVGHIA